MKKKENKHEQASAIAEAKIIDAARKLFIEKGFSGTSISAIAKAAGVPQSLLYHYFKNKQDLWRKVKAHIMAKSPINLPTKPITSINALLEAFVLERFRLHAENPDLVRLLLWQVLEGNNASLTGTSDSWLTYWQETIERLQNEGKVGQKFSSFEIILLLNGIVWAPFTLTLDTSSKESQQQFCEKMVPLLKSLLT